MVTPLTNTTECTWMNQIGEKLCGTSAPKCDLLNANASSYAMFGWDNSDAVIKPNVANDGAAGENIVTGDGDDTYFAYCVECSDCQGIP